jgi:tetratricopeptide (TPR) repeat protein
VMLDHQGNYAQAVEYFDKALAIDPNYKFALNGKGWALYYQGNYAQAIPLFDKALAIDPNYQDALSGKQNALSNLSHDSYCHYYHHNGHVYYRC